MSHMLENITFVTVDYTNPKMGADMIDMLDAYAKDPMGGGQGITDNVKRCLLPALAKRNDAVSILCYVDDVPAGLANCFESFSTFKAKPVMNIHDFVVLSGHRKLGLSQKLLDAVQTMALARGCCKLTLELLEGNKPAMKAYLKFGFDGYELDPEMGKAFFWEKVL